MSDFTPKSLTEIDNEKYRVPIGELRLWEDNYKDITRTAIDNIKKFLFNPICVQICNKYKKLYKKGFNSMLYLFPKINPNKEYNNDEVASLFCLTNDEVTYLLS